jgi:hypothetical protein
MRFVNNEIRMLMNEINNHHKQKDKFRFVKDNEHEVPNEYPLVPTKFVLI